MSPPAGKEDFRQPPAREAGSSGFPVQSYDIKKASTGGSNGCCYGCCAGCCLSMDTRYVGVSHCLKEAVELLLEVPAALIVESLVVGGLEVLHAPKLLESLPHLTDAEGLGDMVGKKAGLRPGTKRLTLLVDKRLGEEDLPDVYGSRGAERGRQTARVEDTMGVETAVLLFTA